MNDVQGKPFSLGQTERALRDVLYPECAGDDDEKDKGHVLMTSLQNSFCFGIFCRELPWQVLMPLALPPYLALRGERAARNQWYIGRGCLWLAFGVFIPLATFGLAAAAAFGGARALAMSQTELCMPFLLHCLHRACVSAKYALLTPAEYARFLAEPDLARAERWRAQMQVSLPSRLCAACWPPQLRAPAASEVPAGGGEALTTLRMHRGAA